MVGICIDLKSTCKHCSYPSLEMIYRSEQSKEDDELELRTRKEKIEKDEEFED